MSCEQNQQPAVPSLCANNCGFYGNPSNNNLCSKCYNEFLKKQQADTKATPNAHITENPASPTNPISNVTGTPLPGPPTAPQSKSVAESPGTSDDVPTVSPDDNTVIEQQKPVEGIGLESVVANSAEREQVSSEKEESANEKPIQANKSRCWSCNSKTGLLGFECRCGYFFCGKHRYAEEHSCSFDYKTFDRQNLTKHNYKVVADKLNKI